MKKINWGIIGLGNIARSFSEGFFDVDNSRLLSISSLNNTKIDYFKNRFSIDEDYIFTKYDDLLNCADIDIVYITLPNNLHYEWVKKCIEKNKRILIEKPAFMKLENAVAVKKQINEKNLFFAEGYMYRYNPQIRKVIEIIQSGEIGKAKYMESSFCENILSKRKFFFFKKAKKIDKKSRLFNPKLGGGCILDLGCYPASISILIAFLTDGINHEKLSLNNIKKEINSDQIEISAEAEINFDGGFTSKIKSSFKETDKSSTIIYCTLGQLTINSTWKGETELIKIKNGKKEFINNKFKKNIYSYQIDNISKSILKNNNKPLFPGFNINETEINTNILERWRNG